MIFKALLIILIALVSQLSHAVSGDFYNPYRVNLDGRGSVGATVDYHMRRAATSTSNIPIQNWNLPQQSKVRATYSSARIVELAKGTGKRSAPYLVYAAAIASAGWAIDELTGQITQPVYQPVGGVDDYQEGVYYRAFGNYYNTLSSLLSAINSSFNSSPGNTGASSSVVGINPSANKITVKTNYNSWGSPVSWTQDYDRWQNQTCDYWYCTAPDQEYELVHNPVTQQQLEQQVLPALNQLPAHQYEQIFQDEFGNPAATPELEAAIKDFYQQLAASDPRVTYDPATNTFTFTDPDTQEQIEFQPDLLPQPSEFPDDYNREKTQLDIFTALQEFFKSEYQQDPDSAFNTDILDPTSGSFIYNPVFNQLNNLPDLPDIVPLPDFGISSSSSCQTITFNWKSAAVVFPSADQCSKLGQFKQIMGWFLYIITWFGVVYIIIGARKVKSI